MKVSITLETNAETAVAILKFAESLRAFEDPSGAATSEDRSAKDLPWFETVDLARFCSALTSSGRAVVAGICRASADGRTLTSGDLMALVELADNSPNEMKLMGFLGGVGKSWSASIPSIPNPFVGRKGEGMHQYLYLIDERLAQSLLSVLKRLGLE